jgi:hypothetical protein
MLKIITTTVLAVLVSVPVGAWLGYAASPTKVTAAETEDAIEVTKDQPVEVSNDELTVLPAELAVAGEVGVPKWAPKPLPAAGPSFTPPSATATQGLGVSAQPIQPAAAQFSVFNYLDAGVLAAYQLKSVSVEACLPYAQRVVSALSEFSASGAAHDAYRTKVHEAVQAGYSVGCFVKQEQPYRGRAADGGSPPASSGAGAIACQGHLDAVVNRIRGATLPESEKQQQLADLYAYAAKSRCEP